VYQWELDAPAQQEFATLSQAVRLTLTAFMDAVVIVDPIQYQRRPDEPASPAGLRTLHFGEHGEGLVTFLVYAPDDLVLVVRVQWLGE
jgi:hypothetical protein